MARPLTAPELAIYRTPHQATRVLFAIPTYHTIYTATLASVPSSNDMVGSLSFENGVGTLEDVKADMTLYVGTSAGAYDLGMCRIRKAPIAGTFYVGETSEVKFDYGGTIYLTVVDDYSLWAKPLRLVSGVAKMDYDLDYSDQHTNFDPLPVLGSHAVGKLVNGTVTLRLGPSEDTASYVIDSSISSYAWECAGASFSSTTVANPDVTFTAAGTYLAYCTVTAANGKTFQGVRYVIIYDDEHPLYEGVLRSYSYDHESGGLSFGVQMYVDAAESDIRRRALVIVVTEDTVENEVVEFACPIQGRENILAVGWIGSENIEYNEVAGTVEFTCHNAAWWFQQMEGYLSGVEFKVGTSDDWTNCSALTVRKMLFHFLHWRTTATRIMDVILTDDTKYAAGFKTVTGGLWEQIVSIAWSSIFASPGVDRFNRLWIEVEQQMVAEASRSSFPEIMDIDNQDWVGGVKVLDELTPLAMLYFSGVAIDSALTVSAYVSLSPGHIHQRYGATETLENYLVSSQADSNQQCGLYFGWKNGKKEYELSMAASHRMIDIWPRQYVNLTITADEDPREIGYTGRAILRRVEGKHDAKNGVLSFTHYYEPETFEGLAIDGDIPDEDEEDYGGGISPFPPMPPLPAMPLPVPIPSEDIQPHVVAAYIVGKGFWYTENFNETEVLLKPTWYSWNSGLDAAKIANDMYFGFDVSRASGRAWCFDNDSNLLTSSGPGQVWEVVIDRSWLIGQIGLGAAGHEPTIACIGINRAASDSVFMIAGNATSIFEGKTASFVGSSAGLSKVWEIGTTNHEYAVWGGQYGIAVYGYGEWLAYWKGSTQKILTRFSVSGNLITRYDLGNIAADLAYMVRGGTGGQTGALWNAGDPQFRRIENNGAALIGITGLTPYISVYQQYLSVAISPDGTKMVGLDNNVSVPNLKISTDGGTTWSQPSGWSGVGRAAENCGDDLRWIVQAANGIIYSGDFFSTWESKTGDLNAKTGIPLDLKAYIIRYIR